MEATLLTALSPLDGRYRRTVAPLAAYFSEHALMHYRVAVEVAYLMGFSQFLAQHGRWPHPALDVQMLRDIVSHFTEADAQRIKDIEATTNHDVKAVEYWLREKLTTLGVPAPVLEFVHFGLTSQDVNNTAIPLSLWHFRSAVLLPRLLNLIYKLEDLAAANAALPMLARTHGQPASPTTLGKEIQVFVARLWAQVDSLAALPVPAKFGGATGNLNAHHVAYPGLDWDAFATELVEGRLPKWKGPAPAEGNYEPIGPLTRSRPTTQIEHYDGLAAIFDASRRINVILIDLCRDMWQYISMGYFRQRVVAGEVGSSAMPHKVNPIDFENAEGNLGIANALFDHLSNKLPISRLQRDLTDSTVLRNLGVPYGHTVIALTSLTKGLGKLDVDTNAIAADLEANWAVVAEGIQTVLRREAYPDPYNALKALTRTGKPIDAALIAEFITGLDVSDAVKAELRAITPQSYIGNAAEAVAAKPRS